MPRSKDKPLKWDAALERVLALTFEGRWTNAEIAEQVQDEMRAKQPAGAHPFTLSTRAIQDWRSHPDFQARLEALRSDFAESLRAVVYTEKHQRLIGLAQMAESARRAFEEKPWIVQVWKSRSGQETRHEEFNADAFNAFRGALDDIAKELGERRQGAPADRQIALIAVAGDVLDAI